MLDSAWEAQLRLSFVRDGARCVLQERSHVGPLRVQRPFYPEGEGVCHVYVLHPPGGLVGGDRLITDVSVEAGAHSLLTTPAAAKLYRSRGGIAEQTQLLRVATGARLEWLPQETIAFDGALGKLNTRIELAADARFFGWDVLCLGRPAASELFARGEVAQALEIWRAGKQVYCERGSYVGGGEVMHAAWGLANFPVVGTFVCAGPDVERWLDTAREVAVPVQGLAAVSGWQGQLVARYLGPSAEQAREYFTGLWSALRPGMFGSDACPPRIWRT